MLRKDICLFALCVCVLIVNVVIVVSPLKAACDGDGNGNCNTWMNPLVGCCMNAGGFQGYSKTGEGTGTPWLEEIPNQQCAERFDWYYVLPCSDYQEPCGGSMGQVCSLSVVTILPETV